MRLFLLVLVCLFTTLLKCQLPSLAWANPYGTDVLCETTCRDNQGFVYTTGFANDTVDFDPGPGTYSLVLTKNAFVAKYQPNGALVWAKALGVDFVPVYSALGVDSQGNVCVSGTFYGTVDIDPGPAVNNIVSRNGDVAIVKMDSNGNFLWAGSFGSSEYDQVITLKIDVQNNIYVCGNGSDYSRRDFDLDPGPGVTTDSTYGGVDGFVVKLNANGNYLWGHLFGSWAWEGVYDIEVDAQKNLLICGKGISGMDVDPGPAVVPLPGSPGMQQTYLLRLDSTGAFTWLKKWDSAEDARVKFDKQGNIILLAGYYGTLDVDPGPSTQNIVSWKWLDAFLVKLTSTGQLTWARSWHDSGYVYPGNLHIDGQNNIYLSMYRGDPIDLDPGPAVITVTDNSSVVMKLDASGSYIYSVRYPFQNTISRPMIESDTSGVYLAVWFKGVADLDPGPSVLNDGVAMEYSSVLLKLSEKNLFVGLNDGERELSSVFISPNPASTQFKMNGGDCMQEGCFIIRDNSGRIVEITDKVRACEAVTVHLSPGLYFCTWSFDQKIFKLLIAD